MLGRTRRGLDRLAGRIRRGDGHAAGRIGVGLGPWVIISLVALALAGSAFGWVVIRLLSDGRPFAIDRSVLDFFTRHRTSGRSDAVQVVTTLGSAAVIIPATILVGGLARGRSRTWRPLLLLAGAYAGASGLQRVIKDLVARPRPPVRMAVAYYSGWSFPSGHATQAAAWWGALALVVAWLSRSWRHRVIAWTVAVLVAVLVGLTRCYLGAHWASDVVGGWALGWTWLGVIGALSWATVPADAPASEADPPPLERVTAPIADELNP